MAGYALAPHTTPSLYADAGIAEKISATTADICDRDTLKKTIAVHGPEIVIHLAAQAIVGRAHTDAFETWRANALGTVALLEALRGQHLKALSIFTTDKVYDNHETGHPHREEDPIGGFGIYDASKGATELAVRAFMHGNAVTPGTAIIRAGNVVGGGDWNEARLLPDCARAFAEKQPVKLRHPQSVRPWQHVLDVCYATLRLTQALYDTPQQFRGAWNIGPDPENILSASAVAERMGAHWQQHPAWVPTADAAQYPEANVLLLDSAKLMQALNWKPILGIEETLHWTAQWYRDFDAQPGEALAITAAQIDAFEQKAII